MYKVCELLINMFFKVLNVNVFFIGSYIDVVSVVLFLYVKLVLILES